MTALTIGKQHLVSVVIPIQPPTTLFLACRLNNTSSRHQLACYWARLMQRQIIVHSPGEMVFVPIAPLPDGRYNGIGRLVVNPGNGRLIQNLLWAAGLGY